MAMLMAAMRPQMLAGVVLNDIGPEIDPAGAARIQSYAGRLPPVRNWDDAAAQMKMTFGLALPEYTEQQWRDVRAPSRSTRARTACRASPPIRRSAMRSAAFRRRPEQRRRCGSRSVSCATCRRWRLRGAHSDLLSAATFERMQREVPSLVAVTVANRGHAPQLDEPDSLRAIDTFLAGLGE